MRTVSFRKHHFSWRSTVCTSPHAGNAKMNPSAWQGDLIAFTKKKQERTKTAKPGPSSLCQKTNQVPITITYIKSVTTLSCKGRLRPVRFHLSPQPFSRVRPPHRDMAEVPVNDIAFPHLLQHHLAVHYTWLLLAVGLYTAHKVGVGRIQPLHEHHQGMLMRAEKDQQSSKPKHCQSLACSENCFPTPQQLPKLW